VLRGSEAPNERATSRRTARKPQRHRNSCLRHSACVSYPDQRITTRPVRSVEIKREIERWLMRSPDCLKYQPARRRRNRLETTNSHTATMATRSATVRASYRHQAYLRPPTGAFGSPRYAAAQSWVPALGTFPSWAHEEGKICNAHLYQY
jgi:hypothetical protein